MIEAWLLGTYILGTCCGIVLGVSQGQMRGKKTLLQELVTDGYLKVKKDANGNIVLVKFKDFQS